MLNILYIYIIKLWPVSCHIYWYSNVSNMVRRKNIVPELLVRVVTLLDSGRFVAAVYLLVPAVDWPGEEGDAVSTTPAFGGSSRLSLFSTVSLRTISKIMWLFANRVVYQSLVRSSTAYPLRWPELMPAAYTVSDVCQVIRVERFGVMISLPKFISPIYESCPARVLSRIQKLLKWWLTESTCQQASYENYLCKL